MYTALWSVMSYTKGHTLVGIPLHNPIELMHAFALLHVCINCLRAEQNVVYLGQGGDIIAETRALLMANNVNHGDFSQDVLNTLTPLLPSKTTSDKSNSRADTGEHAPMTFLIQCSYRTVLCSSR
jgi:hypothetical protein